MLSGSDSCSERAAAIYTLIGSARLNGMDSEAYLHYVIERIANHPASRIDELLPWNVAPHRGAAALPLEQSVPAPRAIWMEMLRDPQCAGTIHLGVLDAQVSIR